jgi:hypothetical protein
MAKYDPLSRYLRRQTRDEVGLTFAEIENLLTTLLPKRAHEADWWSPGPEAGRDAAQCRAWREAGYEADLCGRERVVFRRIRRTEHHTAQRP